MRAQRLGFRYPGSRREPGRVGVRSLDLVVERGERIALIGPNGSGKSTLIRLLATDLTPSDGVLELLGRSARSARPALRRRIAHAGDRPLHWEALTGAENLRFFGAWAGRPPARPPLALARTLGLAPVLDEAVARYSFGMRRRLLLAEALSSPAELVVLDEPTVGLDPEGVAVLGGLLQERAEEGAAIVFATNEVREVPEWATRVLFLHEGRVVADAPPAELLGQVQGRTRLTVRYRGPAIEDLGEAGGCSEPEGPEGIRTARIQSPRGAHLLPGFLEKLLDTGAEVREIQIREPDLRDVFRELTGVDPTGDESDA